MVHNTKLCTGSLALICAFLPSVLGATSALASERKSSTPAPLKGIKRILFLGDSITYAGGYVDYVQAAMMAQGCGMGIEVVDAGLPSETVSGLSEPGHAGGAFPRPCLHERLDRILKGYHPDLVFACYGMNDGIYYPLADDRFNAYKHGYEQLADAVKAAGAKFVAMTPPPFDAGAIKGSTLPAGRDSYPQPYEGYDQVLGTYSDWLLSKRKSAGWQVIDLHGPLNRALKQLQAQQAGYHFAGDGVHMNAMGHWLAAREIIGDLQLAPLNHTIRLRAAADGKFTASSLLAPAIPVPDDAGFNPVQKLAEQLDLGSLKLVTPQPSLSADVECRITVEGSGSPLFAAVGLTQADKKTLTVAIGQIDAERSRKLLASVHSMRQMLTDAWLTHTGHKRPGMAKGVPIAEAEAKEIAVRKEIEALLKPVPITVQVEPAKRP